jgi:N-acetyltransferase
METQLPEIIIPVPASPMNVQPVTLEGVFTRLEPLSLVHHAGLCEIGLDAPIWQYYQYPITTPDEMRAFIETAQAQQAQGISLPFAIVEQASGRIVGSTRFMNIDRINYRVEIGTTWQGQAWWSSPINTEAKYLLLRHAFETLKCMRVEIKTDSLNQRARRAIERIGMKFEGIFRNHMIMSTGRMRHSAYYSVVSWEWEDVKQMLEAKMSSYR